MYDIIPDLHGHAEKLEAMLQKLGWQRSPAGWRAAAPGRQIVFLGDFIDRGTENTRVIRIVRSLIDGGHAQAIMGNHELNAIMFHTRSEATGAPLRAHSAKNLHQHAEFLKEFAVGSSSAREAAAWMRTLPLYLDLGPIRAVHAMWSADAIADIDRAMPGARLTEAFLQSENLRNTPLYAAVGLLTSGEEITLPDGYVFHDKQKFARTEVRVKWWLGQARTWREIAISVEDISELPDSPLPTEVRKSFYHEDVPVFFGHYWLSRPLVIQARNALCLDYSVGMGGPLVAYRTDASRPDLTTDRFVIVE